jgi:hypothetical protein
LILEVFGEARYHLKYFASRKQVAEDFFVSAAQVDALSIANSLQLVLCCRDSAYKIDSFLFLFLASCFAVKSQAATTLILQAKSSNCLFYLRRFLLSRKLFWK